MHVRTKLAAAVLAAGAAFAPALLASTSAASHAAQVPVSTGYFVHTTVSDLDDVPALPTLAVAPRQIAGEPIGRRSPSSTPRGTSGSTPSPTSPRWGATGPAPASP